MIDLLSILTTWLMVERVLSLSTWRQSGRYVPLGIADEVVVPVPFVGVRRLASHP